ncbi:MAG: ATP-binding protein, partial [Spirulina sp.]
RQHFLKRLFKNSIGSQLFLNVLIAALIGLGCMAYFFYQTLETREKDGIRLVLNMQVQSVEEQIQQIEQLSFNMVTAVRIMQHENIQDEAPYRDLILELFERYLSQGTTSLMALGFGQTPTKIVSDRQFFWPYFALHEFTPKGLGEHLQAPHENIRYVNIGDRKTDGDYTQNHYYTEPVKAGKFIWLKPYQWHGNTYTSFAGPIFDGDRQLLGATGADLNVTALSQQFNIPVIKESGYFIILSREGNLLAYPPDPQQAINFATYEDIPILKAVYENIGNNESGIIQAAGQYWTYQRVAGIDWLILAVVPKSVVLRPVLSIAIGGTTGAGAILALVVILFVQRLNRRLQPILEQCQQMSREDVQRSQTNPSENPHDRLGISLKNDLGGDEIDILNQSFNQMTVQLKTSVELLETRVKNRTAQLAKAKEAAEVANQAKSEFIANMSHELRTPLNAILGFSQIMMRSRTVPQEEKENLSIINRSGDYLLTLINNILDFSKIEAGRMLLAPQSFDLHALLQEVEDLLTMKATHKGLYLAFDRENNVPQYIRTDETKLRQVLINLINNGIKFTSEGGISVTVTSHQLINHQLPTNNQQPITNNQQRIFFKVEDTGVGIAEEELGQLFEAFGQTESGRQSQEGTGLGLPISQKFVQLMGGEILVSSTPGKGTTFTFDIEAERVDASHIQPKQISRQVVSLKPGQQRYKILIADDRPHNRLLLVKLLQPLGFDLQEASNGREAVEKWEIWQPHLIFMDMRMPIMDGYEATRHIKQRSKGKTTPIVALTASVLEEDKVIVLSAGCDDFLRKPFRDSAIFETIGKHLGVEYIYAEEQQPETTQSPPLKYSDLEIMPSDWRERLYNASKALDDDLILELIAEIPNSQAFLADRLTNLLDNFQFKRIRQLLEEGR